MKFKYNINEDLCVKLVKSFCKNVENVKENIVL